MSTPSLIKISGLLKHQLDAGTTTASAIKEEIDNGFDAGARRVLVKVDTRTGKLYVVDDGAGMTREDAEHAYYIHNNKAASEKNGLRGIGKTNAEAYLSNLEKPTCTYTDAGGDMIEIVADWPESVAKSEWNPSVSRRGRASREAEAVWETHKLAPHGTVVEIPLHPARLRDIVAKLPEFLADMATTYQFLLPDRQVSVVVDDDTKELPEDDCLGWDKVGDDNRNEAGLQCWRNGSDLLIYHTEGSEWVRFDYDKGINGARIRDHDVVVAPESGWILIGTFVAKWVYNPADRTELGYTAFVRNNRLLFRMANACTRPRGMFDKREFVSRSRMVIFGTHKEDVLVHPLGNKSAYTPETIDADLLRYVRRLADWWATKYHAREKKRLAAMPLPPDGPAAAGGGEPINGEVAQLTKKEWKLVYNYEDGDEEFRRELRELLRRYLPE